MKSKQCPNCRYKKAKVNIENKNPHFLAKISQV